MGISVVVSNFNGARFLPRLLGSLAAQRGVVTEVIIVDRHSQDSSLAVLRQYPNAIVLHEPAETGLVAGYTVGARAARHELLFFCNEDMWFDPDCLRRLQDHINLENRVGAADPWQWSYDGGAWIHGGVRFKKCIWAIDSPFPFRAFDFTVPLSSGDRIPLPCAGAFLIHRVVFDELGGWDTSFYLNDEDTDLFLRAWQRRWLCVTAPEARVYHAVGASNHYRLPGAKQTVNKRRYISYRANKTMIAIKYFSGALAPTGVVIWLVMLLNNLTKLRFRMVGWDFLVLRQILARVPGALQYRAAHARWNRERPGEGFFRDARFGSGGRAPVACSERSWTTSAVDP